MLTRADFAAIDQRMRDVGHRYRRSAQVSVTERPHAYRPAQGVIDDLAMFSFAHPQATTAAADAAGWEQRGVGDNVVPYAFDLIGTARYVLSSAMVPPATIAIIDDSGGTLTAPIREHFAGVLCAGATVRVHLGILTREYGIPCLMNAKLSGSRDGDSVKMKTTARAKTAAAYQHGISMTARVWRRVKWAAPRRNGAGLLAPVLKPFAAPIAAD